MNNFCLTLPCTLSQQHKQRAGFEVPCGQTRTGQHCTACPRLSGMNMMTENINARQLLHSPRGPCGGAFQSPVGLSFVPDDVVEVEGSSERHGHLVKRC